MTWQANMERFAVQGHEPLIDELLDDPITRLLMKTDGVVEHELRPLIEQVADLLHAQTQALN